MFLAFSVLFVVWQACYAIRHDAYATQPEVHATQHDAYEKHHDAYPKRHDAYKTQHDGYDKHHDAYPKHHDAYPKHHDSKKTHHEGYKTNHDAYKTNHDAHKTNHDAYKTKHAAIESYHDRVVQFPNDFSFGVSTSAYQHEGAWDGDGKGENIWDRFLHTNRHYANGSNGDVAADGYYQFRKDIELLKFLNVRHYRLSLSWSSVLPNGLNNYVNQGAVDHYRELFKLLRANQIEPFVTLYHWDLPQCLEDMGGFLNENIVSWFSDYARLAFQLFGDDVKYWSTFNEPYQICANGYGSSLYAPALNQSGVADYICGHNLLKAHAAAWHIYDKEFRKEQCGRISINIGSPWIEPASDCDEDRLAAENQLQFSVGWFANPIYNGDYPEVMKQRVNERSELQGEHCRLPEFSEKEIAFIKGTHDYFSLNSFGILRAQLVEAPLQPNRFQYDVGAKLSRRKRTHTYGVRNMLGWIKKEYNNPSIFITENGYGSESTDCEDPERITYIKRTLNHIYDALTLDNVRVYGYTYWSFMDGFEWNRGYRVRFGLFAVDFHDRARTRTPRTSALWYKQLCSSGCTRYEGY